MPPPMTEVQIAQTLPTVVAEIQKILSAAGSYHGVLRGSMEAVIAEAQGAEIVGPDGTPFNHLENLKSTLNALRNNREAIRMMLDRMRALGDYDSITKIKNALQPLLTAADESEAVMTETRDLAEMLRKTAPGRLSGIAFGQGGLGTQLGRTVNSLITTQIQQLAAVFRSRGIDPTLVPRELLGSTNALLEEIEEQPIAAETAAAQAAVAAAASRGMISAFLSRVAASTAASEASALWRAVGVALEAMWAIGGRLISVPIIILDENGDILGTGRTGKQI